MSTGSTSFAERDILLSKAGGSSRQSERSMGGDIGQCVIISIQAQGKIGKWE